MVKKLIILTLAFSVLAVFISCGKNDAELKIGHSGGYLSAALYAADYNVDAQNFRSSSDTAYLLLSGLLDAGFVDADRLAAFAELDGFENLTAVGKVTYPYGATLILRKDLNLRLHELNGLTIAASEPHCKLLEAFSEDADRLGADISGVNFVYMPFHTMLPALESRTVDAAIIRGASTAAALHEGHSVLYQNWEVEPGDECCPAIIDQAVLVLLARRDRLEEVRPFVDALVSAQGLSPDELRHAVAKRTVIPFELLQGQPVPEFSQADDEIIEIFTAHSHEYDDHDHDDEHGYGGHGDHEEHHD